MLKTIKIFCLALAALSAGAAQAAAAPSAADALRIQAGGYDFSVPSARPSRLENSPLNQARADWQKAAAKYSDRVFRPSPQHRVDTADSRLVLLQGFHWYADSYWLKPSDGNGWWGVVAGKAAEIGRSGFDMVWLPPVSKGSYYPTEWYNLDSQWGTKANLQKAVAALHSSGVMAVADVVLNHRNGTANWADFTNPDWPTTVITRDDEWPGVAGQPYNGKSANYDEGQGETGCRDLDHTQKVVQDDAKVFMRWLRNEIGFDGWRYDMVKGYPAYYVQMYNEASSPVFSVGEYYDTNRQMMTNWIDGTDSNPGKTDASTAFDFTTRYNLVGAVESERAEVVWGNHVALEDDLARGFGEARPVTAWWREAVCRVRGRV